MPQSTAPNPRNYFYTRQTTDDEETFSNALRLILRHVQRLFT